MEKAQEAIAEEKLRAEGSSRKAVVTWKQKQREDQGDIQEDMELSEKGVRKRRSICEVNKIGEAIPNGGQDNAQETLKNGSRLAMTVEQPYQP
jgi:hypothetical protein